MLLGGGLVVFVSAGSASVSAQGTTPVPLDENQCRTGGYFQGNPSDVLVAECEILVRVRNAYVSNLASTLRSATGFFVGEATHPILTWGESGRAIDCGSNSCRWEGVEVGTLGGSSETSIVRLDLMSTAPEIGLAGQISTDLCGLGRLTYLRLDGNFFSGDIPGCLGNLLNLRTLSLADNGLSGAIPASVGALANLNWFAAGGNALSGVLPPGFNAAYYISLPSMSLSGSLPADLGRSDGCTVYLDLSNNGFDGEIPASYTTRFTSINVLDLSNNKLRAPSEISNENPASCSFTTPSNPTTPADYVSNWINNWINSIRLVDTKGKRTAEFSLQGNEICYSSPPTLLGAVRPFVDGDFTGDYDGGPTLERASARPLFGTDSRTARFFLGGQTCSSGQQYSNLLMPPISNPQISFNEREFVVSWDSPSAASLTAVTEQPYSVTIDLSVNPQAGEEVRQCLGLSNPFSVLRQLSVRGGVMETQGTPIAGGVNAEICRDLQGSILIGASSIYRSNSIIDGRDNVNIFAGESLESLLTGWRAFNVTQDGVGKDASQIARDLGVPSDDRAFSWDAANQAWVPHPALGESGTLAKGTAVMFRQGVAADASLAFAGVGRVDEDIVLTLHQGWNLMAPVLTDGAGDSASSQAVGLFDGSLSDCDNTLGVLALVTYNLLTEAFEIYLPCHGDLSVPGYGELDEIGRYDSLFVFFQSQLPVPITWDPVNQQYTPNI